MRRDQEALRDFLAPKRRIATLAQQFPTLADADGLTPFDPHRFDAWSANLAPDSQGRFAAKFILSLFDSTQKWDTGSFDVVVAFRHWDTEHRTAFLGWSQSPWFFSS